MTRRIGQYQFAEFGSSDVLQWQESELTKPGVGEVTIEHTAIGVNYIDIYHRSGQFAAPLTLPSGLGVEGAGVISDVGAQALGFNVGDEVVYAGGPPGAYANVRNVPAGRVIKLPSDIAHRQAAALFFKGLTAEYLIRRCYRVQAGTCVVLHAAAGGVGQIVSQWLKHLGATVIGVVSTQEKAELAEANGCDHVVMLQRDDLVKRVTEITNGKGVDVVYDSVGRDTFEASLACLKVRGTLVSFGAASGPVAALDIASLGAQGSVYLTRPSIAHYTADRHDLETAAQAVFDVIRKRVIRAEKITEYPLSDAPKLHQAMQARETMGSLLLVP
ncbi:MAG: quinone oxidoreductase family protein [Pseudomonadales bacterium]